MWNAELVVRGALVVLLLALSSLLYWDMGSGRPQDRFRPPHETIREAVDAAVDSLLVSYRIDRTGEKKWTVKSKGGTPLRIERRVLIPADLVTLLFNRDLGIAVRRYGGHVVGTERTRESVVVLHVVVGGMTLHTISLEHLPMEAIMTQRQRI
ncbi:MAG: hypothetical protein OEV30_08125 [Ignavibacteria bacterium]|nr:hypothetical protein [Ignavibacteria bacterium]